jgi:general secretion pathway protein G
MQRVHDRADRRGAFTLVEFIVVIAIITILAGIVSVRVIHKPAEARIAAARLQIKEMQTALQMYRTDAGRYPTQEQGLEALVARPTIAPVPETYPDGGYLEARTLPRDPWKHEFIFLVPGRNGEPCEIISYGSDGEPGGQGDAADLTSAEP